jgi:hypothetical protein
VKNKKRLIAAVVLTCVFSLSAFAGESLTPSCAPPDPGIILTPPCADQTPAYDSAVPGETTTPPASNLIDASVTDVAIDLLQSMLSIF